jgi:hypothetical protein
MLIYLVGVLAVVVVCLLSYWLVGGAPFGVRNAHAAQRRAGREL